MREWLLGIGSDQGQTRRRRRLLSGSTFAALALAAVMVIAALAASFTLNLEGYNVGTVNGQDGWSSTGSIGAGGPGYDHQVVANTGVAGFDTRSFRISNAVTSGSFGDHTFTRTLADEAGETSAVSNGMSGGTR